MGYRVWVIEASGKTKAFKAALAQAGLPKDRVIATFGRLFDLPKSLDRITSQIIEDPSTVSWEEIRPGQVQKIISLCRGADEVMLATDSDLEGELIAHHLNQHLGESGLRAYRVCVQAINPDFIRQALLGKSVINTNKVDAATSRRLFDRHLGFQLVSDDDHFAMSMGRVISPLIQSLTLRPPITTRIECELLDGWKAVFRLPNYLSVQAETLCGVLSALKPIKPVKQSQERVVLKHQPLTGPEAIVLCANQTTLPLQRIVEGLQQCYMDGEISYPRTDSRRLSEISMKWARRMAEKSGRPFNPEYAVDAQAQDPSRSFDAHDAIVPLTDRMVGKAADAPELADKDQGLAAITQHCSRLGERPEVLNLEVGTFAGDEDSARWKTVTRGYLRHLSLERLSNQDNMVQARSVDGIGRKPDLSSGRVRMWRDPASLAAAKRMIEIGLGRPSTIGLLAEKASKIYLTDFAEPNGRARLMLHKVEERCPLLLKDGVAREIESHLVSLQTDSSVSARILKAWRLLEPEAAHDESGAGALVPPTAEPGPSHVSTLAFDGPSLDLE